jgi:glycosyltransferase involved in cell wall biosynthesis
MPLSQALGADRAVAAWQPAPSAHAPLVLLSQVAWDDVWQRPQEHALRAAAHRPVIYLSPVQIHEWRRNMIGRWNPVRIPKEGNGRLIVLSPLVYPGHYKSAGIFLSNGRLMARWLGAALRRLAASGALTPDGGLDVLLNTPLLLPLVERLEAARRLPGNFRVHYDVIDDFAGFDWAPRFSRNLDRRLIERARSLTTGTRELARRLQPVRPDATFVPLGVNCDLFGTHSPAPADMVDLPRPIIGYFGTLSDRLDYPLLQAVADAYPGGSLVLIGPVRVAESVLPRGGNVRVLGLRPHGELPGYAQAFDVGLIPFRVNEANRALNPVKALEYLAAGVPVVSTDLPDVRSLHTPPVFLADHPGGAKEGSAGYPAFLQQVEAALKLSSDGSALAEYRARAKRHAAGFTWQAMAQELELRMGVGGVDREK